MRKTLGDNYSGCSYGNSVKLEQVYGRIYGNLTDLRNTGWCIKNRCTFASEIRNKSKNKKVMKRRIIYVGTLIDLAAMFEPDVEAESIEVTNILKYDSYE